jgi:deoxynucleotide monophosphate kinase-like protein
MIVGLTGYAGTGKDTVGVMLVREGWARLAFADNVRALALAANPHIATSWSPHLADVERLVDIVATEGWDTAKRRYPEVRRFLQALGSGVRNVLGDETWIEAAMSQLSGFQGVNVVVTDVRHENEAAAIRSHGGVIVRVNRPGVEPANDHVTETGVDDILADYPLPNWGDLNTLRLEVTSLLGWLGRRVR